MKYPLTPQVPLTRHHRSTCHDGDPDICAPSYHSEQQNYNRCSLSSKSYSTNKGCETHDISTGGGETFNISTSSHSCLCSCMINTRFASGHAPHSRLLTDCRCLHECISRLAGCRIAAASRLSLHDSDTLSPALFGTSYVLLFYHSNDISQWDEVATLKNKRAQHLA